MSKLSDPRAEKERDYTHQRVIVAEYPHLWVKAKRKKKQGTQRAYRRKVKQVLLEQTPLEDTLEHRLPETVQRQRSFYYFEGISTFPLGVALGNRLQTRANMVAFNLFKKPYDREKHQTRFAALLEGLMYSSGEKIFVRELALRLNLYLNPEEKSNQDSTQEFYQRHNRWLEAFFEDEPILKPQFEAWIARVLERN